MTVIADDIKRFQDNREDELNSAALYTALAAREADPRLAEVYRRLAATETKHADQWAARIAAAGGAVKPFRPDWRTRTLIWLANRFGPELIMPTLAATERQASAGYAAQPEAVGMVAEERSHAVLLQQINRTSHGAGMEGSLLARMEGRHRAAGGNALRAAVLGASDGLVSNFNLVMGVAGAEIASSGILLTGLAGLLAGAISMALGEWISVQSSRELYEKQLATERYEIAAMPEEETEELVLIYQARGLDQETARLLAAKLMSDPATALDALARDELGIDPDELGGSAWEAAITSFLLFAVGAVLPVLPFFFAGGTAAIILSAAASAAGLFAIGAAITLFTGKPVLYAGLRQTLFGLAAAGATYAVGRLVGVTLTG
ncbi:VIT1/CCC1 transporter family protein [Anaeroselena agilis]|uniref:VIT1/CCC1 transporter family protein n=1 Tax=Anaeroselena agilis TaxID=3063788 RepID=A0ABU3P1E5_9FIRM|nr:VIT1/CCC1 transporter family protein [Selenomonadales bacterium 4137-cl]